MPGRQCGGGARLARRSKCDVFSTSNPGRLMGSDDASGCVRGAEAGCEGFSKMMEEEKDAEGATFSSYCLRIRVESSMHGDMNGKKKMDRQACRAVERAERAKPSSEKPLSLSAHHLWLQFF